MFEQAVWVAQSGPSDVGGIKFSLAGAILLSVAALFIIWGGISIIKQAFGEVKIAKSAGKAGVIVMGAAVIGVGLGLVTFGAAIFNVFT